MKNLKRSGLVSWAITCLGLAALVPACNFVVGGASLVAAGGAAYMSWQCYDHVAIRVRDMSTALFTCNAEVSVQSLEEGGGGWTLLPCYHAALTTGRWRLTARLPGHEPMSTELVVAERAGACPHYTHTVEMSLWPEGMSRSRSRSRIQQREVPVGTEQAGDAVGTQTKSAAPSRAFELTPSKSVVPSAAPAPTPSPQPAPAPTPSPQPAPAFPRVPEPALNAPSPAPEAPAP